MTDSQAPPKSDHLPCPFSHLLLALIAVAPAVITVPANLNIVLTAAVTVWVGSKRSVKDTPPEESMTRTVRLSLRYTKTLVPLTATDQLHTFDTMLPLNAHLAQVSDNYEQIATYYCLSIRML